MLGSDNRFHLPAARLRTASYLLAATCAMMSESRARFHSVYSLLSDDARHGCQSAATVAVNRRQPTRPSVLVDSTLLSRLDADSLTACYAEFSERLGAVRASPAASAAPPAAAANCSRMLYRSLVQPREITRFVSVDLTVAARRRMFDGRGSRGRPAGLLGRPISGA